MPLSNRQRLAALAVIFVGVLKFSAAPAQVQYQLIDIGGPGEFARAEAINSHGWIVGYGLDSSPNPSAVLMRGCGTSVEQLPRLAGFDEFLHVARAINDGGLIVGLTQAPNSGIRAVQWGGGVATQLAPLQGYGDAEAHDVNGSNVVVGDCWRGTKLLAAVKWVNGVPQELLPPGPTAASCAAFAINDNGSIAGEWYYASNRFHAALWINGMPRDLGALQGDEMSRSYDINGEGWVVGSSWMIGGNRRGFLWNGDEMVDLFPLVVAKGINSSGAVVGAIADTILGTVPAIWQDGVVTQLPTNGGGGYAFAINDSGEIVGEVGGRAVMWRTAPFECVIADVPADQGGHLLVSWRRHAFESMSAVLPVTEYVLQRYGGGWMTLDTVAAAQSDSYSVSVPTDDVLTINQPAPYSKYRVLARTLNPLVSYESQPDSAFSIDNLPPPKPDAFLVEGMTYRYVTWTDPELADLESTCVYRGEEAGFVPGTPISCPESFYTENHLGWYFYRVQFTDIHGNVSELSDEMHGQWPTPVPSAIPQALKLHPCQPNPFNPRTTIRYDLPEAGAVHLAVFDIAGRLVRTLVDESKHQGIHEAIWDGRDSTGRDVGSGSYLARLEFGGIVETTRMGLVR